MFFARWCRKRCAIMQVTAMPRPKAVLYMASEMPSESWAWRWAAERRGSETALKVKMMRQKARLPYARENGYAVVALPYVNDRFLMYCFLPDQGVDPLVEELKNSSWSDLSRALHPTEGSVALPKFKFAYGTGLQKELTELGLGIAFDAHRADFTRMVRGGPRFYIGSVIHKTFLEVDEEGSTAAAVTGIQMRATAMVRPREEFNLVFDRPFVAAIVDEKSGTSLFLGIVEKPES